MGVYRRHPALNRAKFIVFLIFLPIMAYADGGLIKDIRIHNAFPLFEKEISNALTISVGQVFSEEEFAKQELIIQKLFQKEGFIESEIFFTAEQDHDDKNFVITIRIEKGSYYRLDRVELYGNQAFSGKVLKLRMKTWQKTLMWGQSRRFIETELREDIKNLTRYYREKHYPDVSISYTLDKDEQSKSVSVLVKISEGRRYDITFDGNKQFWNMTLKKDLVLFQEGNISEYGLKNSLRNIRDRYRKAGYLEAKVKSEDIGDDEDKKVRKLRIRIDEGPRSLVKAVKVSGNTQFDNKKIRKQMLTRRPTILYDGAYIPEVLEEDMDAIASLYLMHGYMDAYPHPSVEWQEDAKHQKQAIIKLDIDEGVKTVVYSVNLSGLSVLSLEEAYKVIQLKQGDPFRQYMVQSDVNALSSLISEKGYPHVEVKGDVVFSEDKSCADVTYLVNEGHYTEMGTVVYSGNFKTQERILNNELEMKPDDPFSLSKMMKTQQNFRNMDIFDSVQFKAQGLKEKESQVNLVVEVEEKKPFYVQTGIGYDTERNFYLQAKAGNRNLWGLNKSLWTEAEVSQIGHRADIGVTEPRLFGSRISAAASIFSERKEEFNQEFGISTNGASLGFNRKLSKYLNVGLSFRGEQRYQYLLDEDSVAENPEDYETRTLMAVTPSISYDSRDSFFRPKKGIMSSLSADISKGIDNTLDDFIKYRLDTRAFVSPFERLTFAFRTQIGYIDPYNSDNRVPTDQLFFLGGTSDIRGFGENLLRYDSYGKPMGGRTSILGSIEARWDLGMNFELTTFYDIGKIGDTNTDADTAFRSSVGFGLRYITPIGPIGFLYGFKLDHEPGEDSGRLHFSVGYTF